VGTRIVKVRTTVPRRGVQKRGPAAPVPQVGVAVRSPFLSNTHKHKRTAPSLPL
jgi:hypothetical protein